MTGQVEDAVIFIPRGERDVTCLEGGGGMQSEIEIIETDKKPLNKKSYNFSAVPALGNLGPPKIMSGALF